LPPAFALVVLDVLELGLVVLDVLDELLQAATASAASAPKVKIALRGIRLCCIDTLRYARPARGRPLV
jgi:hypothetical protein